MSSGGRRAVLVVVLSVLASALLVGAVHADQFVGERFAPVVSMADSDALNVQAISVEAADDVGTTFVVTFARPFEPPSDGYRVALSAGDPTGKRTRATLQIEGGQAAGNVESGDGVTWDPIGPTTTLLDPAAGRASIVVPSSGLPSQSAVWVDVELPTPVGSLGSSTPYFSYDSLVRPPPSPTAEGSVWGSVRDAAGERVEGASRVPGAPPAVGVVNRALVASSPEPPPNLLLGQPVVGTADFVRLLDGRPETSAHGYVLVNRVSGDVGLYIVEDGVATEVPGATQELFPTGVVATEPPGTRPVSLDLGVVERLLGLPDDPSRVAVSVDRASTLADGQVVMTTGVAATVAALESAVAEEPGDEPATVVDVAESSSGLSTTTIAVLAGVGALLLVAVGVGVTLARRSKDKERSLIAEGWFDRELRTTEPLRPDPADDAASARRVAQAEPPVAEAEAPVAQVEAPVADVEAPRVEEPRSSIGVGGRAGEVDEADDPLGGPTADEARTSQRDAIALLEAELAELIDRVDRLGGDGDRTA
jgi:hypothetical protein